MYIWSANVGWTYFGYDPLGRCVKRWADNGDAAAYKYGNEAQREVYKNLPTAERLNNPDNYMEFAR